MIHKISPRELIHAQIALFVAIGLQVVVWRINQHLLVGQYFIIPIEIMLVVLIGLTARSATGHRFRLHHALALTVLGLLSFVNISSLLLVLQSLVTGHMPSSGLQLLSSALAIFVTNIIVFGLWYWEIDSPGLTRRRWSLSDKDFQFTQQDMKHEYPDWQPAFLDYMYLSVTNAINFAPADARPLTHSAKALMGIQALVSVFTLALVIARSVSILGT